MNSRPTAPSAPAHAATPAGPPLSRLLQQAAAAVQAVRAGRSLNDALARVDPSLRPGTQALAFHALRWMGSAETVRGLLAKKAPPPAVDALLLTALALLWPDAGEPYPAHTVVDQAVEAARRVAAPSAGFVNAVLRRFGREREALVTTARGIELARYNHRPWWIARLRRDWPRQWEAILAAANTRPPMTLRVNLRHGTVEAYRQRLADAGLAAEPIGTQGLVLAAPCPVGRLPGWAEGHVSVQDAAAQLAAPLLLGAGLPAGARVLDACAAPGGKTAHLLELADLDVLALDSDATRLARVQDTLKRLSLRAATRAADAADTAAWWDGRPFDAILLDAPCSASGIVRRHPDVRWLRRDADIAALAATQDRLLEALWPTLATGGRLLYCTCSVFRAEGAERIDAFLQRHPDAIRPQDPPAPGHLLPLADNAPQASGAAPDGFFYALLERRP